MSQLRRASVFCRNQGLSFGPTKLFCLNSEIARCYSENHNLEAFTHPGKQLDEPIVGTARFYNTSTSKWKSYVEIHSLSSKASAKSNKEQDDDSEDSLQENVFGDEFAVGSFSGNNLQNELEASVTETGTVGKSDPATGATPAVAKAILAALASSVAKVMDKWVEEGNEVTTREVVLTMVHLRKNQKYDKALQMIEWLESKKHCEFVNRSYAFRVDLIAKVHGISAAEKYIKEVPEAFRTEVVYRTLLANCVSRTDLKKSEKVFNKMKELFPITVSACNQMLLLYQKTDKMKIAGILKLMEKENINLSSFSYQVSITAKLIGKDINGVEQLIKKMKSEGIEPNTRIKASLAHSYAAHGLKDKAEAVLKEMERADLTKIRWLRQLLLPVYASLGRENEVERIWKVCESSPKIGECTAAINAWGQLNKVENAEAIFQKLAKPDAKHFLALLNIYVNHKMVDKGKELVRRMAECGISVGPLTWDALVRLYIGDGQVEKADSILDKAIKQGNGIPMLVSYIAVLEEYARRGDVHNAENILFRIRQAGYGSLGRPYQLVLMAYVNAKAPAYGFRQRLKGDNIVPVKLLADLLDRADVFTKSPVEELLE